MLFCVFYFVVFVGMGVLEMNVIVVRIGENVFVVWGLVGGGDVLYMFGVVYVVGVIIFMGLEMDGVILVGGNKFFIGGRLFNIYDCGNVIFENVVCVIEVLYVEEVDIVIFWCGGEIESFYWWLI